ncbi:MAG: hypothetical protein QXI12_05980 [Candidatus Methanomethyliaceae archaeon]
MCEVWLREGIISVLLELVTANRISCEEAGMIWDFLFEDKEFERLDSHVATLELPCDHVSKK